MPTATTGATKIHYEEKGTGRPIVLLHGYPLDSRIWSDQLEGLASAGRVIAPDLPGFGRSLPAAHFTMESAADMLRAFLAGIGALPCVLGGLSMGGYITLAFARKYPNDLAGLMLIDTRAEADTDAGRTARTKAIEVVRAGGAEAIADQMLAKMLSDATRRSRPAIVSRLNDIMSEADAKGIEYALVAMRDRLDQTLLLPSIKIPTLIVVGQSDAITPPPLSQAMNAAIAGSTLAIIRDAGHMTPMEQPRAFNEAALAFLSGRASP